jgi:glycerol-3-phosphate dehydrogenase
VTGTGVALDAAARGLSVALCERTDLAAGTSRWSSKLVHGGLRYLARGELGLARESARERAVLMGVTAPHLVRRLPFLVPDVAGRDVSALAGLGGRLGDAVRFSVPGGRRSLQGPARVPADTVSRLVPAPARLVHRYGTEAPVVAGLGMDRVVEGRPETVGVLRFAVLAEGARSVADLLDRRTRFGLVSDKRAAAEPVAEQVLAHGA